MKKTLAQKIRLVPLVRLETHTQMKIREIRNEPGVRRWMYTDHIIGANEHLQWISGLKDDETRLVFAVLGEDADTPLGMAGINALDRANRKADWAYYLTEQARGGLGAAVEYAIIEFAFDKLGLRKLNCEVIEDNEAVVKLHRKFLFEDEGLRRSQIEKDGSRVGVRLLGLTFEDWANGRAEVYANYQKVLQKFSIDIEWHGAGKEKTAPIDAIEAARARNNLNWMSILRLALEKSPDVAGPVVKDIQKIDREISGLTQDLLDSMHLPGDRARNKS